MVHIDINSNSCYALYIFCISLKKSNANCTIFCNRYNLICKEECMPVCPECFSKALIPHGYYRYMGKERRQWKCEHCGRVTAYPLARKPSRRRQRR